MNKSKQEAQDNMRMDTYEAIRRNLFWSGGSLSRHEVVAVLVSILSAQLELIRDDAQKQSVE
jgi:hypothetical protein